ncbi:phage regulatory CII family protein [Pseudomonas sp. F1_0610]|uniref:phage regulatory CII family protein n=1 Tax=Pseudomonas sp. F1_0610 TaxID=3114284 RepID=UPI0039C120A2
MSRKNLVEGVYAPFNLRQALYRASRDFKGGQTALALTIGIDPSDLSKRLNPSDERLLKPELIEEIVAATKDQRLLNALVRPAGAVVFTPKEINASDASLNDAAKVLTAVSDYVKSLADGLADGVWQDHEVDDLRKHGERVINKVLGIIAGAEQALEENHG